MNKRQVLVVGAGPGGSSASFYLAKAGIDVLMVDKETWPRDKPCGDGQSAHIWSIYKDMGIFDEVMSVASKCRGFIWTGKDEVITKMLDKEPWIICTPRRVIDDMTRKAAVDAGAEFMENYEAVSLIIKKGFVKGVKGYYRGTPMDIFADVVIIASGSHSQLARQIGIWTDDPELVFYGARGYFDNVNGMDNECIEEHYCERLAPSGYMWIFPTGGKKANVGIYITEKALKREGMPIEEYFEWWKNNSIIGKERLGEAKVIGDIKGWRLPTSRGLSKNYISGAIAIGDSANMIDCWSGGGYFQAMEAGKIVGEELVEILHKGDFSEEALSAIFPVLNASSAVQFLTIANLQRTLIFEEPEVLKDCLEYIRGLPGYPNIPFTDAVFKILVEEKGVKLDGMY